MSFHYTKLPYLNATDPYRFIAREFIGGTIRDTTTESVFPAEDRGRRAVPATTADRPLYTKLSDHHPSTVRLFYGNCRI